MCMAFPRKNHPILTILTQLITSISGRDVPTRITTGLIEAGT